MTVASLALGALLSLLPLPLLVPTTASASATRSPTASAGCDRTAPEPAHGSTGQAQALTLHEGAIEGSYNLSVPRTSGRVRPHALILLFYGFGGSPARFTTLTRLPPMASADGDIVAVPQIQPGEAEWQFSGTGTDGAFVNALVQHLEATYCVNPRRVFATGFSAGAAFTIFYACSHENQIRAISTVAVEFQLGCHKPIPILAFHGTADPAVPYKNGGVGLSLPGDKVRGTLLNMGDWARLDHCRSEPKTTRIGSQVTRSEWLGCEPGMSVTLYSIIGGGHDWPGANPKLGVGLTTQQISATALMLRYFASLH